MKKSLLLSCWCLLGLWTFCRAQNNPIVANNQNPSASLPMYVGADISIASPQVWSFMKYGGSTPNLYTGTVSASIPIYTYQDQDFTIPLALSYASNGYMPNVQANDVGLGWFLNVGGCITRTVRGVQDNSYDGNIKGYAFLNEADLANSHIVLDESVNRNGGAFRQDNKLVETEPDIYSFNFMGHTGTFTLAGRKVYVFGTNDPQGEYSVDIYGDDDRYGSYITITTGDGYRYRFTSKDDGSVKHTFGYTYTRMIGRDDETLYSRASSVQFSNTWLLSEITAPNGRRVSITYDASGYTESYRIGGGDFVEEVVNSGIVNYISEFSLYAIGNKQNTAQIQSINIDNDVRIDFAYGSREKERYSFGNIGFSRHGVLETLKKLDAVTISKKVLFSLSRDTLKRCDLHYVYAPTASDGNPVMMLNSVTIPGEGTYNMSYYKQNEKFPCHGTLSLDYWGYANSYSGSRMEDFIPQVMENPNFAERLPYGDQRKPDGASAIRGMLQKLTYPTGGYTTFEYEPHSYIARVQKIIGSCNLPQILSEYSSREAGGLRIAKITDYTDDAQEKSRTYTYGDTYRSSGNLLIQPYYYYEECKRIGRNIRVFIRRPVTDIACYYTDRTHIEYAVVTERYNDRSRIFYEFYNYYNLGDIFSRYDTWRQPDIEVADSTLTNNFWRKPDYIYPFRGALRSISYYDAGTILKKITNKYDIVLPEKYVESIGFMADRYYIQRTYLGSFPLLRTTTEEWLDNRNLSVSECSYNYNTQGQLVSTQQTNSNGSKSCNYTTHVFDIPEVQRTKIHREMINRNYVSVPVEIKQTAAQKDGDGYGPERTVRSLQYDYALILRADSSKFLRPRKCSEAVVGEKSNGLSYTTTASYDVYDTQGNLLQMTDRSGVVTSYIWGYHGLYPVAKISGVTNAVIQDIVDTSAPLAGGLSPIDEVSLRNLPGALVTTYKYDPHVGMTRLEDPAGCIRTFTYNAAGKLSAEYNTAGKRVRSYIYSTDNN